MDTLLADLEQQLKQAPRPRTAKDLRKIFPKATLDPLIQQLVDQRAAFAWPPEGKRPEPRYWHRPPEEAIREAALAVSGAELLGKAQLLRKIRKAAWKPTEGQVRAVVDRMLAAKELTAATKPGSRAERIASTRRPEPLLEAYRPAFAKLMEALRGAGLGVDAIRKLLLDLTGAAPPADLPDRIYRALSSLEPVHGAVASVPKLRAVAELAGISKADFDAAALQLYRERRVFLEYHDYPQSLSPQDRDQLVFDGKSTYYVGISAR